MKEEKAILEEALKLDPRSKIYLALAKLYIQDGEYEQARQVLEKGLEYYPDSIDTLLKLVSVYAKMDNLEQALDKAKLVFNKLTSDPVFWELLLDEAKDNNLKLALAFLVKALKGEKINWEQIIWSGLQAEIDLSMEEEKELKVESDLATPSLGAVLEEQGELNKALEVYQQLESGSSSSEDKQKWQKKIAELKAKINQQDVGVEHKQPEGGPEVESEQRVADTSAEQEQEKGTSKEEVVELLEELADALENK